VIEINRFSSISAIFFSYSIASPFHLHRPSLSQYVFIFFFFLVNNIRVWPHLDKVKKNVVFLKKLQNIIHNIFYILSLTIPLIPSIHYISYTYILCRYSRCVYYYYLPLIRGTRSSPPKRGGVFFRKLQFPRRIRQFINGNSPDSYTCPISSRITSYYYTAPNLYLYVYTTAYTFNASRTFLDPFGFSLGPR